VIDRIVEAAAMTLTARTSANRTPERREAAAVAARRTEKLKS